MDAMLFEDLKEKTTTLKNLEGKILYGIANLPVRDACCFYMGQNAERRRRIVTICERIPVFWLGGGRGGMGLFSSFCTKMGYDACTKFVHRIQVFFLLFTSCNK
jgi:hypothetical protein